FLIAAADSAWADTPPPDIATGLLDYWTMEGGGTSAIDSCSQITNCTPQKGTLMGNMTWTTTQDQAGNSQSLLQFDGNRGDYVLLGNPGNTTVAQIGSGDFSASFWVNYQGATTGNVYQALFGSRASGAAGVQKGYAFDMINSTTIGFVVDD